MKDVIKGVLILKEGRLKEQTENSFGMSQGSCIQAERPDLVLLGRSSNANVAEAFVLLFGKFTWG